MGISIQILLVSCSHLSEGWNAKIKQATKAMTKTRTTTAAAVVAAHTHRHVQTRVHPISASETNSTCKKSRDVTPILAEVIVPDFESFPSSFHFTSHYR